MPSIDLSVDTVAKMTTFQLRREVEARGLMEQLSRVDHYSLMQRLIQVTYTPHEYWRECTLAGDLRTFGPKSRTLLDMGQGTCRVLDESDGRVQCCVTPQILSQDHFTTPGSLDTMKLS